MSFKKCKGCGERYEKQPTHQSFRAWCSDACALTIARAAQDRSQAKRVAKAKKRKAELKTSDRKAVTDLNRRSLSWQHKRTQPVFNRMRVLQEFLWFKDRNQEPTCISCSKPLGGDQWACGHFKTVGAQGSLRYDPINTFLQHNKNCNQSLSGDIYGSRTTHGYVQGLKNRFGDDKGQEIIDYCETDQATTKWDWERLEGMRKRFNAEIRRIEKLLY